TTALATAGRGLIAVMTGPVGIIALAATTGIAMAAMGRDSKTASGEVDGLTGSVNALTVSLNELNRAGLALAAAGVRESIDQSARLAIEVQDQLDKLQKQLAQETPGSEGAQKIIQQMA